MTIVSKEHWSARNYPPETRDIAQGMLEVMGLQIPGTPHYGYGPIDKIPILVAEATTWDPPVSAEIAEAAGNLALMVWREQHVPSRNRR